MTQDRNKFINVAIDRETARILEDLAKAYQVGHPKEAVPGKTGIIRLLAYTAARDGISIDRLGPLDDGGDYELTGPGRGEWQRR